jgi:hypothetical protein
MAATVNRIDRFVVRQFDKNRTAEGGCATQTESLPTGWLLDFIAQYVGQLRAQQQSAQRYPRRGLLGA